MIDTKALKNQIRVERLTVSCALTTGRRGDGDFVSLTVKGAEGDFSLEEAHMVHKIVSKECTEMAYMDALAKGHGSVDQLRQELNRRKSNYDKLIQSLEKSYKEEIHG